MNGGSHPLVTVPETALTRPPRLAFVANETATAQEALLRMQALYPSVPVEDAEIIVALGGDGFMPQTLHQTEGRELRVYGMNRGTVGFLMNGYEEARLLERLATAEEAVITPLAIRIGTMDGGVHHALAINEVSLLRAGPQAAKLRITVGGKLRLDELICDGALVCTPAGSTAYNYSAHGPILPIDSDVLALTPMAAFRPRRWRGALLHKSSDIRFDVLEPEKRPVMADADGRSVRDVSYVEIRSHPTMRHRILFDPGHGLEERLTQEQFV